LINLNIKKSIIYQGNLDPIYLLSKDKVFLKDKLYQVLEDFSDRKFIFNLGHGILPETPIENVNYLIETIREYEKKSSSSII
jgi:uroporphyrinogen decarboxylase